MGINVPPDVWRIILDKLKPNIVVCKVCNHKVCMGCECDNSHELCHMCKNMICEFAHTKYVCNICKKYLCERCKFCIYTGRHEELNNSSIVIYNCSNCSQKFQKQIQTRII